MMKTPAPTPAQKVVAAFRDRYELCGPLEDDWVEQCLAAGLHAAAYEVVPEPPMLVVRNTVIQGGRTYEEAWTAAAQEDIRTKLLTIVTELESRGQG